VTERAGAVRDAIETAADYDSAGMKTTGESGVQRLLDVGRALTTELDQQVVLERVLETAREVTGARYAALGVLNESGDGLERFLTAGIDDDARRVIGDEPRGRGVLGELIEHPHPLRLADVGEHPRSYGFPPGHPEMHSFLGVPIVIRGSAWGNLYLTEKDGGAFTDADEESAVVLADWAAIAIENARLYERSERRRHEVEQAFRELEATRDVAVAIGGEVSLERLLELIVKRGRALVGARSLVIMLREGDDLVVQAAAGHAGASAGVRVRVTGSIYGEVLEGRRSERVADVASRLRTVAGQFGVDDPHTALLVPMIHRGDALGILAAFDRGEGRDPFNVDDERMLRTFAANAATAVALARSVESERLRTSLAAADAERRRWARELHDETLQGLAALRVLLSAALRSKDPEQSARAMHTGIEHIEREIANLRALITELRPAALDELGLGVAIEALLDRHREHSGFEIDARISLPGTPGDADRLEAEIEMTVYRLIQEALTNVAKHANASTAGVVVQHTDGNLLVEVSDNGTGFDASAPSGGFGLTGMRERVSQAGGSLDIASSSSDGTIVRASVPLRALPPRVSRSLGA
jgi:signal transduction histidine kinase